MYACYVCETHDDMTVSLDAAWQTRGRDMNHVSLSGMDLIEYHKSHTLLNDTKIFCLYNRTSIFCTAVRQGYKKIPFPS